MTLSTPSAGHDPALPAATRRAILQGAAMLTVVPHAVLGGVPELNLSTADGRTKAPAEWFGLPPAPPAYHEEDPRGGFLLNGNMSAWFRETDLQPHLRWIFNGDTAGVTAEEQRTRLLQDRAILTPFPDLDETEQGIMVEAMERLAGKKAPMEVVLTDAIVRMQAHQARMA